MGIAVRHIGRATLLGAGALATTLAAEVMAARRHRFVPSHPPLEISGTIGPEDGDPTYAGRSRRQLGRRGRCRRRRGHPHLRGGQGAERPVPGQPARPRRLRLPAPDVVGRQLPQLDGLRADIVLVCVGTNDVTHGTTLREARRQLRLLVAGLAEVAPDAKVIVSGCPRPDGDRLPSSPARPAGVPGAAVHPPLPGRADPPRHLGVRHRQADQVGLPRQAGDVQRRPVPPLQRRLRLPRHRLWACLPGAALGGPWGGSELPHMDAGQRWEATGSPSRPPPVSRTARRRSSSCGASSEPSL